MIAMTVRSFENVREIEGTERWRMKMRASIGQ